MEVKEGNLHIAFHYADASEKNDKIRKCSQDQIIMMIFRKN